MGCKSSEKQKQKHRKGLWSPEEDQRLKDYLLSHGHGCWSSVPINAGLQRNGKSCRLRWINYLRPGLKRGVFSAQEDETIMTLHKMLGNKWSQIAQHLPGRTDNEIKNYWHSYLKKKVLKSDGETEFPDKTHSSSSNPDDTGPSSPTFKKPRLQLPSSESSVNTEMPSSTNNDDQSTSVLQILQSPKEPKRISILPKIMFAEWLSLESFTNSDDLSLESFTNSDDHQHQPMVSRTACDHNPSLFQDSFMNGYLMTEGTCTFSRDQYSTSDGSSGGDIFSSDQFKLGSQISTGNGDDQFDFCSDFDLSCISDVMYI